MAPVLLAIKSSYTAFKGLMYLVILILSIVTLAGAAQSQSTGMGKFNTLLSVIMFLTVLAIPLMKVLPVDKIFDALKIPEDKHYLSFFAFVLGLSVLIYLVSANNAVTDSKEKTQTTNAKRAATGIAVLTIIILAINHKLGLELNLDVTNMLPF